MEFFSNIWLCLTENSRSHQYFKLMNASGISFSCISIFTREKNSTVYKMWIEWQLRVGSNQLSTAREIICSHVYWNAVNVERVSIQLYSIQFRFEFLRRCTKRKEKFTFCQRFEKLLNILDGFKSTQLLNFCVQVSSKVPL